MHPPQAEYSSNGTGYALPSYAFEMPPELQGAPACTYPVLIVGAGLGGLTLAVDLLQRGVPVVLVDEDSTVGVRGAASRGICYAQKSLEIFARLGIYDRIAAKGVQWQVGRTLDGDAEVYRFDLRDSTSASVSVQPPFINIQQYYIELFLVERFLALTPTVPGSSLRWQSRVGHCAQDEAGVRAQVSTPQGSYHMRAAWLVDASGVHSAIRTGFNLAINGVKGEDRWCISDVRFKTEPAAERWTWIRAPFNENRAVWQHLMADGVWRLDYQMPPNTDMGEASREDVVTQRLKQQFGADVDFELVWVGPYGYRSQMLDFFQHGRVLFVGDVAHVMSPFGARGGNSAIQDADNLGWKLAAVLQGVSAPALLGSYSDERVQAARENIAITRRTMRFLAAKPGVETTMRQAVLALAKQHEFARNYVNTGRMSVATTYAASPLNVGAGAGRSVQNVALTLAGEATTLVDLAAQLDAGVLIFAWGAARSLLPQLTAALPRKLKPRGVAVGQAVHDERGYLLAQCLMGVGEQQCAFDGIALIRPDLHIAGVATREHALALVAEFVGRLNVFDSKH